MIFSNDIVTLKQLVTSRNANNIYRTDCGWKALHFACSKVVNICENTELIDYLVVQCGADIDALTDSARTPLHLAVFSNPSTKIAHHLLKLGANVHLRDELGRAPLDMLLRAHNCYDFQKRSIAWLLLEYGSKVAYNVPSWLKEMDVGRKKTRTAAVTILAIHKFHFESLFQIIGKDCTRLIAQIIWSSRVNHAE